MFEDNAVATIDEIEDTAPIIEDTAIAVEEEFTASTKLQEELKLGASQFHKYRRHLKINTHKMGGNKAYFDLLQAEKMRSLYSFIQSGGTMDEYPRPEPSGPGDWVEEGDGGLVYSQAQPPAPRTGGKQNPGYITGIDPNRVKAKATAIAKEQMIAEMLGGQLALNPELLSPEDRDEVESYRSHFESAFPKPQYSPQEITALLIPLPVSGANEGVEAELLD